ncbi:MAG TPA: cadherin-like domain-containing protein, partial [Isosphaeraceae bacterium]|nr:cadherin-like domain-containing protein [Isosphaeraceae bacterium]
MLPLRLSPSSSRPRTARARRSQRPCCDQLEDRRLLSTINPNAIPTVGVYDENVVNKNTVDFNATGSTITSGKFADYVASQYSYDYAGVINGAVLGGYYSYGADHDKVLDVRAVGGTNWGIGAGYGISGSGAFASTLEGGYNFTSLSLTPESSGERVTAVGVTVLSISNQYGTRDYGNVTVTATLASGDTLSASRHINEATGQGDTFYGFTAPEGDSITGFSLRYDGAVSGTPDTRLWFDDIGFVTQPISTNQPPVAKNDSTAVNEDTTLTVAAPGVLGNDTDPNQDALTAELVSSTTNGHLDFHADGSFTYTPDANFHGTDQFSYKASDGSLDSNVATVTITVNSVNDPPTVTGGSFSVPESSADGTP